MSSSVFAGLSLCVSVFVSVKFSLWCVGPFYSLTVDHCRAEWCFNDKSGNISTAVWRKWSPLRWWRQKSNEIIVNWANCRRIPTPAHPWPGLILQFCPTAIPDHLEAKKLIARLYQPLIWCFSNWIGKRCFHRDGALFFCAQFLFRDNEKCRSFPCVLHLLSAVRGSRGDINKSWTWPNLVELLCRKALKPSHIWRR